MYELAMLVVLASICSLRDSLAALFFFFFKDTAPPEIYPLPLHDALPIYPSLVLPDPPRGRAGGPPARDRAERARGGARPQGAVPFLARARVHPEDAPRGEAAGGPDRKSTRLNSSHRQISYAVFFL